MACWRADQPFDERGAQRGPAWPCAPVVGNAGFSCCDRRACCARLHVALGDFSGRAVGICCHSITIFFDGLAPAALRSGNFEVNPEIVPLAKYGHDSFFSQPHHIAQRGADNPCNTRTGVADPLAVAADACLLAGSGRRPIAVSVRQAHSWGQAIFMQPSPAAPPPF